LLAELARWDNLKEIDRGAIHQAREIKAKRKRGLKRQSQSLWGSPEPVEGISPVIFPAPAKNGLTRQPRSADLPWIKGKL
jgi:hypothetical protein